MLNKYLVSKVFTDNLSMKLCGRDNCIALILHLNSLYPDIYFGDENTGILNLENTRDVIRNEVNSCL